MTKYIKIVDGTIEKYPYTFQDLRRDNPNVSFTLNYSDPEGLKEFNVYILEETLKPSFNPLTQTVVEKDPILKNGSWVQVFEVKDADQTLVEMRIRSERNNLLSETDYKALSDNNTSQEWIDYRQALRDITAQEGFPYSVEWPIKPTT